MCLQYNSLENTVGKGEIACNEQFLLFPQCFLPFWRTFCHFCLTKYCHLQALSIWKGLNIAIWERVKPPFPRAQLICAYSFWLICFFRFSYECFKLSQKNKMTILIKSLKELSISLLHHKFPVWIPWHAGPTFCTTCITVQVIISFPGSNYLEWLIYLFIVKTSILFKLFFQKPTIWNDWCKFFWFFLFFFPETNNLE